MANETKTESKPKSEKRAEASRKVAASLERGTNGTFAKKTEVANSSPPSDTKGKSQVSPSDETEHPPASEARERGVLDFLLGGDE